MRVTNLLGCLLIGLWHGSSAFEVELRELVNPSVARVYDNPSSGLDQSCDPRGCTSILTRDGSLSAGSRYGCTQQSETDSSNICSVTYRLNEERSGGTRRTMSSLKVGFTTNSETTIQVLVDDQEVFSKAWTGGEKGSTALQDIPVRGYLGDELELVASMSEGNYLGITEVEIYVDVDEVPVTGIAASERVSVTASATVDGASAKNTLDGRISKQSTWTCSKGDVCEITYDMLEVQSTEQLRIDFVDDCSTVGATFNVYAAGADGIFSVLLSGMTAGLRDSSLEGLQTFGGVRALARYIKIEGVPGSGGKFSIHEVDIRVKEDAPSYPTKVDSSLVPIGRLPLGYVAGDQYDPRPASEGGCSAGIYVGCHIYNIKDGDNSADSRWSCSPKTSGSGLGDICHVEFKMNGQTYLRQIQLAFYKGDERHNEFSIYAYGEDYYEVVIPSAISSGDTTDFQTWDLPTWTSRIEIQPKFGNVAEWISIQEMILLGEEQSPDSTPIHSYSGYGSTLKTHFSFDLLNVDSEGRIYVGGNVQTARIWALNMKFPSNKRFTFEIRYYNEDDTQISTRFTSAGEDEKWEQFVLPETVVLSRVVIVAVEGPDIEDYPTLRVIDCQVLGEPYTPGSRTVLSTTILDWYGIIPDYIGDGKGDQEEIMMAICDGIGEGFDGTDCNSVATGSNETPVNVRLVEGDYYLDGPVFLKSGISLFGDPGYDGDTYATHFVIHGSGTGADGVVNADGVSGVLVRYIGVESNLESAGPVGTVGNVGFDIKDSEDITIVLSAGMSCPLATARFVDTTGVNIDELESYGRGSFEGPEVVLDSVTDFILTQSEVQGAMIKDCTRILIEGDLDDGDLVGLIDVPKGGNQLANVVISGTTSGVTLKDIDIPSGAEPRIVLENSNPITIDAVSFSEGTLGDCIIQIPQGSDGNAILTQLNVETELLLEGDCFVLA